jgi:hypothetical protein
MAIWLIIMGIAVTGCAPTRPNVFAYPHQGQSAERIARDQHECHAWAREQTGFDPGMDTARGAGVGALLGALGGAAAGAAIGAAAGNPGKGAAIGAAAGGLGGAAVGGGTAYTRSQDGYDRAYAACMTARGYTVR